MQKGQLACIFYLAFLVDWVQMFRQLRLSPRRRPLSVAFCTKKTIKGSHISEMEVKKSRFIGYAQHVESWDEAQECIASIKAEHPKARHWCFGLRCGDNPPTERCSDDGEPTGTAGVPILGAIAGEDLSDTLCVVVRYFGGIKLGAGGLIRAYGGAARQVLREAPVDLLVPKSTIRATVNASFIGAVYETAAKLGATRSGEEYGADGTLTVDLTCKVEDIEELRAELNDSTRGEAVIAQAE